MKHSIVWVGLFGLTLTLLLHTKEAAAGAFIGTTPGSVLHAPGYTGTGGTLNITVGIDNTSANATAMEISVQNIVNTLNALSASTGNLVSGAANNVPSGMLDFESVALHELGHALGLGHPNVASQVSPGESDFTNSTKGSNDTFDFDAGADGIPGSSDDQRGDDVSLHWFRKSNNNPFTIASTIDSTTYSIDVNDLPAGHDYPANADRTVGAALGVSDTEAVMNQGTFPDEAQRTLNHDDVATLRFAMSGVDEMAGTADDYSINLIYVGQVPPGGADIIVDFDNSKTVFGVTSVSFSTINGNHSGIISSEMFFNDEVNWFFNDTLSEASPRTTLIANFMNGNNSVNSSRVYLWNPSGTAGDVTVRVFTLPVGEGTTQELTPQPLSLGSLAARSARNVKLAEDILAPLGVTLPYTTDQGDLTLEFTIGATKVKGAAQVFSSSFASGTNPLQEIPATSAGSPTVLVANFMNGNSNAFNSRVYLWNPSASAGTVTVRVFTLPLGSSTAQELPGTPLDLGSLAASSAMNIDVADDILTPLGITTPYTTDGGNLALEFTIQAADVVGAAQVFSDIFGFGVYPLQKVPSTPAVSPTVLVASFMNGNSDAFNARVYLFNPSASAGAVTVRVFTLPLNSSTAMELTTTPLGLGNLSAKSALNIKLVEDILDPLQITTPYTTDGGNLTLEFTIQASDVVGAAQVFSSSFAFGTNPLQAIPSTSAGSPTVLVANFVNGNSDALNSRVYLFNPSPNAGNVSVRVFTLPLNSGTAQELTVAPFSLGPLGARSALNIKLVEDILMPLGIATPYTTDGGNLTLEFTIQAGDVRGAAQVFSSSFAFGTYTLSEVPE